MALVLLAEQLELNSSWDLAAGRGVSVGSTLTWYLWSVCVCVQPASCVLYLFGRTTVESKG